MTDFSQATLTPSQREQLLDELASYADTDLLCYFADEPSLYSRQVRCWEPALKALESQWNVEIARTKGLMPIAQPPELKQHCLDVLARYEDTALVAMAQMVTRLGSVLLSIAVQMGMVSLDEALAAAALDEGYQMDEWGEDDDMQARIAERADKVRAAHAWLLSLGEAA